MRKTGGDKQIVRTPCSHRRKPGAHQAPGAILSNNDEEHKDAFWAHSATRFHAMPCKIQLIFTMIAEEVAKARACLECLSTPAELRRLC